MCRTEPQPCRLEFLLSGRKEVAIPSSPDLALDVSDLSIRFPDMTVIRHLSFQVARRSSAAIIGPNGSGKTVLFRALIKALPYEGEVQWAPGRADRKNGDHLRPHALRSK
jgi:ABC-type branched-subunit amino acid transport system ATPase component